MSSERPSTGVTTNLEDLRDRMAGEIVLPNDSGWDAARQAWNLSVDQRPVAVVVPEAVEDVAAVVGYTLGGGSAGSRAATASRATASSPSRR
jgi:hypothetical protein